MSNPGVSKTVENFNRDEKIELISVKEKTEASGEDYYTYLKESKDFKPVRKDQELLMGKWNKWLLMPWRYKWPELTLKLAQKMKNVGINGGEIQRADVKAGKIFEKAGLLFYIGHSAGDEAVLISFEE